MRLLVLNCGSSSLKGALIETDPLERLYDMQVDSLGSSGCTFRADGTAEHLPGAGMASALERMIAHVRDRSGFGDRQRAVRLGLFNRG